jgi:hypothetical protein
MITPLDENDTEKLDTDRRCPVKKAEREERRESESCLELEISSIEIAQVFASSKRFQRIVPVIITVIMSLAIV